MMHRNIEDISVLEIFLKMKKQLVQTQNPKLAADIQETIEAIKWYKVHKSLIPQPQ